MPTLTWEEFKKVVDKKIEEYWNSPRALSFEQGKEKPDLRIGRIETIWYPEEKDLEIEIENGGHINIW